MNRFWPILSHDTNMRWGNGDDDIQGVTLFKDEAGFGLTKTLGILANTKGYSDDPITYSKVN